MKCEEGVVWGGCDVTRVWCEEGVMGEDCGGGGCGEMRVWRDEGAVVVVGEKGVV